MTSDEERIKKIEESLRLLKEGGKKKLFKAVHKQKAANKGKAIVEEKSAKLVPTTPTEVALTQLLKIQTEPLLQQYSYKVGYETDQKCVKPNIVIYSNDLISAIKAGVKGLILARQELQANGFVAAPLGEVQQ